MERIQLLRFHQGFQSKINMRVIGGRQKKMSGERGGCCNE